MCKNFENFKNIRKKWKFEISLEVRKFKVSCSKFQEKTIFPKIEKIWNNSKKLKFPRKFEKIEIFQEFFFKYEKCQKEIVKICKIVRNSF